MTDAGGILLGRAELERAFTALGERLAHRGVVADLFVVGGAAMALAYDGNRVTRDVDAMFVPHGVVLEESRAVANELGLPPWWLICQDFYPDEEVSSRTRGVLEELFE
jgi:hypothetical protein